MQYQGENLYICTDTLALVITLRAEQHNGSFPFVPSLPNMNDTGAEGAHLFHTSALLSLSLPLLVTWHEKKDKENVINSVGINASSQPGGFGGVPLKLLHLSTRCRFAWAASCTSCPSLSLCLCARVCSNCIIHAMSIIFPPSACTVCLRTQ